MVMMGVDDSNLHMDSHPKLVGLVLTPITVVLLSLSSSSLVLFLNI